jgi:hypothetical protein
MNNSGNKLKPTHKGDALIPINATKADREQLFLENSSQLLHLTELNTCSSLDRRDSDQYTQDLRWLQKSIEN